jgi:hypothetical protein
MQPPVSTRSGLVARLVDGLHIMAGASPQDMARLDQRASIQYATLGLVMLAGFVLLAAAWIKVGVLYFGPVGVLVPGLIVPTIFVLGIDRLVAMSPRRLHGELEPYSPQPHPWRNVELLFRVGSAVVLSTLSIMTLFLALSTESIQRLQAADARQANQALRSDLVDRIESEHRLKTEQANARQAQLQADLQASQAQHAQLITDMTEAERHARQSRDDAALEMGGLAGRVEGRGPRFQARERLAEQNEQSAQALRQRIELAAAERTRLQRDLDAARDAAAAAIEERNRRLATLNVQINADARHVRVASGIFADFATLLRLFKDPVEGPGYVWLGLVSFAVLFCLEMCPLLAMALNPSSPLDVLRIARNRELAADLVTGSELAVISARARLGAPIRMWSVNVSAQRGQTDGPGEGPPEASLR